MAEKTAGQAPERAALKWIGGALLGLILGGTALYFLARPDGGTEPGETPAATAQETGEAAAPATADTEAAAPAAEPEVPAESPAMPDPVVPGFDTVRVEADGSVLVAGRAGAGATVAILVDDAEAAVAEADGKGAFAAFFTLAPSAAPRVVTLLATGPDGRQVPSEDSVVIGPVAAPEAVAEAPSDIAAEAPSETAEAGDAAATGATGAPQAAEAVDAAEADADAPDVLIVGNEGVRRQTGAGPVAGIVIDTIGYGATGNVEIAGRGSAGQFARLYLDNAETAAVRVGEDGGWAAVLTDVAPGLYTLRVDQLDGAGKVTSRFETPFQREAPGDVLAALQPAGDATQAGDAGAAADTSVTSAPAASEAPASDAAPEAGSGTAAAPADSAGGTAPEIAAPAAGTAPKPATRAAIVTVQPGYSLWRIARENYGDGFLYVKVFEANKDQIRDPDLIYPGQIFTIPDPAQ